MRRGNSFVCSECGERLPLRNLSRNSRLLVTKNGAVSMRLLRQYSNYVVCFWCAGEIDLDTAPARAGRSYLMTWLLDGIPDNPGDAVVRALNYG